MRHLLSLRQKWHIFTDISHLCFEDASSANVLLRLEVSVSVILLHLSEKSPVLLLCSASERVIMADENERKEGISVALDFL